MGRLNPDSAIQSSEERTWNSEDTQPCSFKVFFVLAMSLHWPTYRHTALTTLAMLRGRMHCLRYGRFAPRS